MQSALPESYGIVVALGAGLWLRQGEIFGLAAEDIDSLRVVVTVRRHDDDALRRLNRFVDKTHRLVETLEAERAEHRA